jgi:F0F1-type ATP synthase membrane subunit a
MQFLLSAADPMDEVLPHTLFHIGSSPVSNQMVMVIVTAILMVMIFPSLFSHATGEPPKGAKNFFESILEFLRVEVFRPALKEHTDRFVPFLWTLFFFILFGNLLGQIPFAEVVTLITHKESHLGGTATGTPITTGALAIVAIIFIHINGIMQIARSLMNGTYGHHGHHEEHTSDGTKGHEAAQDLEHVRSEALAADIPANFKAMSDPTGHYADGELPGGHDHGRGHDEHGPSMNPVLAVLLAVPLYIWNFAPHPFRPTAEQTGIGRFVSWCLDIVLWAFLLVLEFLGAIIKPFALMIRLFANMIAGHIVLASLIVLIPLSAGFLHQLSVGVPVTVLSLLIRFLEIFVAFLQAYIFTFLVTLFIASAVAPEH